MPNFSNISRRRLNSCDHRLVLVCEEAIKLMDFSVIWGHRTKEEQDEVVRNGTSKVNWPNGKHNFNPSKAVDLAPYPIDWSNRPKAVARFYLLAGVIIKTADLFDFKLRWGGDWDGDWDIYDQNFDDLGHFEIVEEIIV